MTIMSFDATSPFDAIRRTDDQGDFWYARDLLMGETFKYVRWEEAARAVARAQQAVANSLGETAAQDHFREAPKMVELGSGARRAVTDYRLTRYGAYMIAMNGDPRKPEIAAAQTYFAVKTREAETRPHATPVPDLSSPAGVLAMAEQFADTARELVQATDQVREMEPKAEAYDAYMASHDSDRLVREVAKLLGVRERWLRNFLVDEGLIFPRYGPCGTRFWDTYADRRRHFRPTETVVSHNTTGPCAHYTLRVTPRGVELIRQRLLAAGYLAVQGAA